jgi:hypothetical protein
VPRDDPNLEYLLVVADALGDLRSEVVFVGGSVAGLLVTDPLAEGVRATRMLMPLSRLQHWASITGWKSSCRSWGS